MAQYTHQGFASWWGLDVGVCPRQGHGLLANSISGIFLFSQLKYELFKAVGSGEDPVAATRRLFSCWTRDEAKAAKELQKKEEEDQRNAKLEKQRSLFSSFKLFIFLSKP